MPNGIEGFSTVQEYKYSGEALVWACFNVFDDFCELMGSSMFGPESKSLTGYNIKLKANLQESLQYNSLSNFSEGW